MTERKPYEAAITPVPHMGAHGITWGWKAEMLDNSTEEKAAYEFGPEFTTADEALKAGTEALRGLIRAYDEVAIYQVDLYKPEPAPEEPKAEEPEEPAKEEEKPEEPAAQPETPAASDTE